MGVIDQFVLRMRRGDGWFFSRARSLYKGLMHSNLPLPGPVKGVLPTSSTTLISGLNSPFAGSTTTCIASPPSEAAVFRSGKTCISGCCLT